MNAQDYTCHVPLSPGFFERLKVFLLRAFLFLCMRPLMGAPVSIRWQRKLTGCFALGGVPGVCIKQVAFGNVLAEVIEPESLTSDSMILYLHGGGFIMGNPPMYRTITTRLAVRTGARVFVPDYRLAPEHPYPAGLDDCVASYQALLSNGTRAHQIVVAGDSAGGWLTLALSLRLREKGIQQPAGLMVMSPFTGAPIDSDSRRRYRWTDPILRPGLMIQALAAYKLPEVGSKQQPLEQDLSDMPPLLIQVGTVEALHDDSTLLAEKAYRSGVSVKLEIYDHLWHVPQLFAGILQSADGAICRLAECFTELTANEQGSHTPDSDLGVR